MDRDNGCGRCVANIAFGSCSNFGVDQSSGHRLEGLGTRTMKTDTTENDMEDSLKVSLAKGRRPTVDKTDSLIRTFWKKTRTRVPVIVVFCLPDLQPVISGTAAKCGGCCCRKC